MNASSLSSFLRFSNVISLKSLSVSSLFSCRGIYKYPVLAISFLCFLLSLCRKVTAQFGARVTTARVQSVVLKVLPSIPSLYHNTHLFLLVLPQPTFLILLFQQLCPSNHTHSSQPTFRVALCNLFLNLFLNPNTHFSHLLPPCPPFVLHPGHGTHRMTRH